jgi:hypothetical protein
MDTVSTLFSAAGHAFLFCAGYLSSLFAASPAGATLVFSLLAFTLAGVLFYGDEAVPVRRSGEKLT